MLTIGEPTILSNTHDVPMRGRTEDELKEKDIKENLAFRKDVNDD